MTLQSRKNKIFCVIAFILLLAIALISIMTGKFPLTIDGLLSGDEAQLKVFYTLRLSRTLVGVFGGFVLGVSGFVFQTIFKNPLASPDIIGVSSGASAGAAVGILFFATSFATTFCAFAGAGIAVLTALLLSCADKNAKKSTIVLAGIAVHSLAQTVLMCLKLTADPERELASIEYWIMGSLSSISSFKLGGNLVLAFTATAILFILQRQTILLSADESEAKMLGVNVNQMRFIILATATLAVSSIISLTGVISFIGLLAPHAARLLTKSNKPVTMLLSGLVGGIILCSSDILAKSITQTELPVSIFTSLLGAPFLIWLMMKRRYDE